MIRINIAIIDKDKDYLDNLSNYLIDNHGNKFQVHTFSNSDEISLFIKKSNSSFEIILVSPDMYSTDFDTYDAELVCFLVDEKNYNSPLGTNFINKYQTAESLTEQLLFMYSTKNNFDMFQKSSKKTNIISMFSPLSGSGKTSICMGLCQKASEDCQSVFYLNLEDNSTTSLFFDTEDKADLSHILFYLKGKHSNISQKIKSIKKTDPASGISYFSPPKSHLELDELEPSDYVTLLREIKNLGVYDYIFVDINSSINEKTVSVLSESNRIVFVVNDDISINVKSKSVIKDFDILYKRQKINLYNKLIIVNNKYKSGIKYLQSYTLDKIEVLMNLPYDENILIQTRDKYCINTSGLFGESLNELYRKL